jgi:hypothetical protein
MALEEMMEQEVTWTGARLKTPRAAAIAGIVFSILFIISLAFIRLSVSANPDDAGTWLSNSGKSVPLDLNLLPFAGIAFLWFIGVLRDRMGAIEDRFSSPYSSLAESCSSLCSSSLRRLRAGS